MVIFWLDLGRWNVCLWVTTGKASRRSAEPARQRRRWTGTLSSGSLGASRSNPPPYGWTSQASTATNAVSEDLSRSPVYLHSHWVNASKKLCIIQKLHFPEDPNWDSKMKLFFCVRDEKLWNVLNTLKTWSLVCTSADEQVPHSCCFVAVFVYLIRRSLFFNRERSTDNGCLKVFLCPYSLSFRWESNYRETKVYKRKATYF